MRRPRHPKPRVSRRSKTANTAAHAEGADPVSSLDRLLHATVGRLTLGSSPVALWLVYADWAMHLSTSRGNCQRLAEKALRKAVRLLIANAGIVSEPGHRGRHCRTSHRAAAAKYVDSDGWFTAADIQQGSWWPAWISWGSSWACFRSMIPWFTSPAICARSPLQRICGRDRRGEGWHDGQGEKPGRG